MPKERCFEIISGHYKGEYCTFISSNKGVLKLKLLGETIEIENSNCVERAVSVYSQSVKF